MLGNIKNLFHTRENDPVINDDSILMVNKKRCPQNHACPAVRVCPVGALSQKGHAAPAVNMDQCIKCGKCVKYCPMRALTLEAK